MRAHVYSYRCLASWFEVLSSRVNVIRKREAWSVMIGDMVNSGSPAKKVIHEYMHSTGPVWGVAALMGIGVPSQAQTEWSSTSPWPLYVYGRSTVCLFAGVHPD